MDKIEINTLKKMFKTGFSIIADNFETINDLNVFPVPDGDTGTNLKITTSNAWEEISSLEIHQMSTFGRLMSRALLMNARGNSGVIFSQIIKGFFAPIDENVEEINLNLLLTCFNSAKDTAYHAVSKPIEGTILTVIKDVTDELNKHIREFDNFSDLFKFIVEQARISLNNTPNLLPALKKAEVVDSGGYGLWCFFLGIYKSFDNDINCYIRDESDSMESKSEITKEIRECYHDSPKLDDPEKGFGYCSEAIIKINSKIAPDATEKKKFNLKKFKEELLKMGESLVCIQDNDIVKVHVHTLFPGQFLSYAQKFGEFVKIKIENMTEQFYDRLQNRGVKLIDDIKINLTKFKAKPAIVITSPSHKITEILRNDYDFSHILDCEDGNPSIEQLLLAIQEANSRNVILVINDSNILLAANQVKGLLEGKVDIRIIVTNNVLESLVCSLEFDENTSLSINEKNIVKALKNVHTAMISRSTKDVSYSNINIKKDDYIGIIKKKIIVSDKDEFNSLKKTIDELMKKIKHADVLIIIYDFADKYHEEILKRVEEYVIQKYNLLCDFKEGKQKVYNYYICVQ